MDSLIFLTFPVLLSIGHFIGIKESSTFLKKHPSLNSFSAGISIAYVFLVLIPEVVISFDVSLERSMLLIVLGFTFFHIILRYIKKEPDKEARSNFTELEHVFVTIIFNILLGYSIVEIFDTSFKDGLVLFIVLLLHTIFLHGNHIHKKKFSDLENYKTRLIIAAPTVGGIAATLGILSDELRNNVLALAAGAIIYIAIREELPEDKKGRPLMFLAGVISVAFLVIVL